MVCGNLENELASEKAGNAALQKRVAELEAQAASGAMQGGISLQELATEKQRGTELEAQLTEVLAMCKELQERMQMKESQATQAKQDAAASEANVQKLSGELRNAEGFNQQLRQELQNAKAMIDGLNVQVEGEAVAKQKLQEQLDAAIVEQRAAANSEVQALNMELSRAQSRNAELETQLTEAVNMHGQAEEKLAAEAVRMGELREMLAAAEAQAQFINSQQAAVVPETETTAELKLQVSELESKLQTAMVEAAACAELRSRNADLESQILQAANRPPSSPVSPSRMDREIQRQKSREIDLEAQLLDAKDRIKDMEAKLATQEERMADTLQQLAASQQQVRQASSLAPDGSNGAKFISEAVVGWLPNLQKRRKTLGSALTDGLGTSTFEAVAKDDVDALKAALLNVANPVETVLAARNASGQTLLHVALANASGEAAKFILEQGSKWAANHKYLYELQGELLERQMSAFVNGEDNSGCTPLQALCQRSEPGKEEEGVIVSLLEASADPMSRDASGITPFIECARSGNIPIMRLLLQITRGAVLLDSDDQSRSALHWSVTTAKKDAVELLLKVKADSDVADIDGKTALEVATAAGHEEIVKLLVDGVADSDDDDDDDEGDQEDRDGEEEEKAGQGKGKGKGFRSMARPDGDMDDFIGDVGDMDDIGNQASPNMEGGPDDEEPELRRPFAPGRVGPGGVLRPEGFPDQDDFLINAADEIPPEMLMAAMAQGMMSPEDLAGPGSPLGAMMMGSAMGFPGFAMPTGMDDADMAVDGEMHGMPGIPGMPASPGMPTSPSMPRSPGSNARETYSM